MRKPTVRNFRALAYFIGLSWMSPTGWELAGPQSGSLWRLMACWLTLTRDYNMHMASCILSLEPQYRWMLMATPLVNGIEDLRLILRFLESSSWLTLQLLPDTFHYTLKIDDDWVADGSNVPITERGAGLTSVANLYKKGPEFGSLVHCTTMAWDAYMLPIIGEVGKLEKSAQTSHILIRWHLYEETIEKWAFVVLCTLMLRRTLVSHIPFKNPKPIINIPQLHVTTELV